MNSLPGEQSVKCFEWSNGLYKNIPIFKCTVINVRIVRNECCNMPHINYALILVV